MTHRDTSFAAYRPWGHVRRRNLIGRVLYAVSMAVLGLGALAGVALLAVFAASVALAVSFAVAVVGFYATLRHKPAHVRVRASEQASVRPVMPPPTMTIGCRTTALPVSSGGATNGYSGRL